MRRAAPFVIIFLLSCIPVLRAQSTNASITGRVTDPSKAVIEGAEVAAINEGTNIRAESATNGSGEYYLTNLVNGAVPDPATTTTVRALVGKLGAESFEVREKAVKDLIEIGKVAEPMLQQAKKDSDAEKD